MRIFKAVTITPGYPPEAKKQVNIVAEDFNDAYKILNQCVGKDIIRELIEVNANPVLVGEEACKAIEKEFKEQ